MCAEWASLGAPGRGICSPLAEEDPSLSSPAGLTTPLGVDVPVLGVPIRPRPTELEVSLDGSASEPDSRSPALSECSDAEAESVAVRNERLREMAGDTSADDGCVCAPFNAFKRDSTTVGLMRAAAVVGEDAAGRGGVTADMVG